MVCLRWSAAEEVEDDGIPFADKMATLTSELADQFAESAKLEKAMRENRFRVAESEMTCRKDENA
ncbi:MAG: hypothetical protein Aurels2KO_28030 [Aureliella sp.]